MTTQAVWTIDEWHERTAKLTNSVLDSASEQVATSCAVAAARKVLRAYSTSFYLVTRFLPIEKRNEVELIYAAVRYPDELVDTFAPSGNNAESELDRWEGDYQSALSSEGLMDSCRRGLDPFVSAFAEVVKRHGIPPEYYISFLEAMRSDLAPCGFGSEADLIDGYVYGSATVVGYFLTYVYGAENKEDFEQALDCARDLAIALQLTNFARDVKDDFYRGRLYIPLDALEQDFSSGLPPAENAQELMYSARRWLAEAAQKKYQQATAGLGLFSRDSRVAMECCIKVYSLLNQQLLNANAGLSDRMSVPWFKKFAALPPSKFWRIPLAYTGFM